GSGNGNGNGNSSTSSNNLNRLTINTAKAMNNRDTTTSFLSSTFQGNESPLLSGISLALSKQKQQYQVDAIVPPVKAIPPLYDVAQPRTPHPLSPADSLKTPGYVDPDSLPFELGSTITDSGTGKQYKLLSVLGEGSYAVVYLALCNHDGAKYALKCLSKLGLTARQLALQRSELEIHSSVCPHPHIVTLYSYFETRDWLFLVMERVSGPDLYDYITQHPAFNANQEERRFVEATRLFEQMIDAVAHIHALKAYHRDLKPENFILGADGNLKLTDFGLATRESLSTDFECGSKPYMSYENRNGGLNPNDPTVYGPRDDYSPRLSDVWALGVLFLNLLFAQSPWTDPSRESCFKFCQFLREGAGFLVGQFPKLPREVADFLVTRVFSPESGRCNVLEFKQWVQALGYPFNPPKPGATAPRPINPRHKPGASGHRRGGGSNVSKPFNPGDEETFGVPAAGPKGSTASDAHAANRVRFSNIPQPSAILPLARINGNGREDKSVHSTDSSLTATLVTSSVDYYSPKMIPMSGIASANAARKANGSHGSSCSGSSNAQGADDADGGVDADDEADSRQRQHKAAGDSSPVSHRSSNPRSVHFSTHATGHHYQHRYHQKHSKHASLSARNDRLHMMQNSMPAPINQLASRPAFIDAQTSFSWADDAEDLPIPGLVSQPSSAAVSDKCDDRNDEALSDELSWPADDDHNQQSDDMFAMEL
ncbi:hypothetical protein GGI12_004723, partial [Dipsacomyces acuminosporus]